MDGYKHQDKTADRKWNSIDYVDVEWISDEYEKLEVTSCTVCREP